MDKNPQTGAGYAAPVSLPGMGGGGRSSRTSGAQACVSGRDAVKRAGHRIPATTSEHRQKGRACAGRTGRSCPWGHRRARATIRASYLRTRRAWRKLAPCHWSTCLSIQRTEVPQRARPSQSGRACLSPPQGRSYAPKGWKGGPSMKASHTLVAAQDGPKAGLRAYEASLKSSGLPTVLAKAVEVLSMPAKQRFEWYCATFGPDISAAQAEQAPELSEVEQLRARIRELESGKPTPAQAIAERVTGESTRTRKAQAPTQDAPARVATRITFPMAMVIKRYASKTGESFEITDKLGKNSYAIKVGGRKVNVAQASALIARIKAQA